LSWSEPRDCCRVSLPQEEPLTEIRDEFLSEEDLDLQTLSPQELLAYWDFWLQQAQATNEADQDSYSHGVFVLLNER